MTRATHARPTGLKVSSGPMRPGIIRGVAVVACVMLGARVSRTDDTEDPETEQ